MSITQTLFGTSRTIPVVGEDDWGPEVTSLLEDMAKALNGLATMVSDVPFLILDSATTTFAAGGTLSQTKTRHRIAGASAAVTLSATTAIANGSTNGQLLVLEGTDDTNTVEIIGASDNTKLNGSATFFNGAVMTLFWESTRSLWLEDKRNF